MMKENGKITVNGVNEENPKKSESTKEPLSDFWPQESVQEILDYIEEQGVYIRE